MNPYHIGYEIGVEGIKESMNQELAKISWVGVNSHYLLFVCFSFFISQFLFMYDDDRAT